MFPYYLTEKLKAIGVTDFKQLQRIGHLKVFAWLKYTHKSLGYRALFDLYTLATPESQFPSAEKQIELMQLYREALPSYPSPPQETLDYFLGKAVLEGDKALALNEVPIGAVITYSKNMAAINPLDFEIIGSGHNLTIKNNDICAHAEINAIQDAAKHLDNHRLTSCDLYVTLEPCLMCMGAILHSRIRRVIFGAIEPKTGAIVSQYQVLLNRGVNSQTEAIGPVNNASYNQQLKNFMRQKRTSSE